jgi:hypothetical protein
MNRLNEIAFVQIRAIATCLTLTAAAFAGFALPALAQSTSDKPTVIDLTWVNIVDRVYPRPKNNIKTQQRLTLTLKGGNAIDIDRKRGSGRNSESSVKSALLGKGWRVRSASILEKVTKLPNVTTTLRVSLKGQSECSLDVTHQVAAGAEYFLLPMLSEPGRAGRYSRIESANATCAIH